MLAEPLKLPEGGLSQEKSLMLGQARFPLLVLVMSLSRVVFTAYWMVARIISAFGFHLSNTPSFEGPDHPPRRYAVTPHSEVKF